MKIQLSHKFENVISLDNLLSAWQEFLHGKSNRLDVQKFSARLMDNIFSLHQDLLYHAYEHGGYEAFKINDPKPRDIHKASVRDRLLHHAVYRILYPFFAKTFIVDSYSCQIGKGTHKALARFCEFAHKASKNNTRTCYILKGDIRKFFASIDQGILLKILNEYIPDKNIIWLLEKIISSFSSTRKGVGLPLGNLTSQLFVNIYMNKFDQFVKHELNNKQSLPPPLTPPQAGGELFCHSRAGGNLEKTYPALRSASGTPLNRGDLTHPGALRHLRLGETLARRASREGNYYIRYADDFVIFSDNKKWLEDVIPAISNFLKEELKLELHPDKLFIKTIASGVDFLGMVNFFDHRILRTKTKKRMLKRILAGCEKLRNGLINAECFESTLNSYSGMLKHCRGHKIELIIG